jgi:ThiF family
VHEESTPSQELLAARRTLEGLQEMALLRDWTWNECFGKWVLHCRLSLDISPDGSIPPSTDWYVLVDPSYPWGQIKFYPAKQYGIVQTFPHQNYNGNGRGDVPWRTGDVCLNTNVQVLGRHGYDSEPFDVHRRLRWYFQRAIDWLCAAARGELVLPGDPFELPQFPGILERSATVAFCEGSESFLDWQNSAEPYGLIDLVRLREEPEVFLVQCFRSIAGRELFKTMWGLALASQSENTIQGIWLRLTSIPVLSPWQAPYTWGELREACQKLGTEVDALLKATARFMRDGKRHIALVGFPIPSRAGETPCQMHWQALKLPQLSGGITTAKGFRTNEKGYWQRDRTQILSNETPVEWMMSENWHVEQVTTRGRLPAELTSKSILLLGAGAVGSVVAELLVRAGIQKLTIVDGDWLEMGNLVRHTLGMDDLKTPKAAAITKRLNLVSPHASIQAINSSFPPAKETEKSRIQQREVILDCTGHDEVLHWLERFPWGETKLFVSISLGFRAQRLFCFTARSPSFPHATFSDMLDPWLKYELKEYANQELPREGIGCWHPVFPARVDDVWLMVSVAVKHLESVIAAIPTQPELIIFEQYYENDVFAGIRRLPPEIAHV